MAVREAEMDLQTNAENHSIDLFFTKQEVMPRTDGKGFFCLLYKDLYNI